MTASLTLHTLGFIWLGAFVGALAVGGAGFAFALAASSIWLHVLDPVQTAILVLASGVFLHVGFIWRMRRRIEPRRLWPFLAGGVLGVPIGVRVLTGSDPGALKGALGAFILAYGLYALAAPRLPRIAAGGRPADAAVGFAGGVLGGLGGYSGVLPTIWTQLRGWPKETVRGVCQPYILVIQLTSLVLVGAVALDQRSILLFAIMAPALIAGAWAGWMIYGRLDERRFRQALAVLLVASGLTLLF
jgi:uncharacterized membrane protein YfcA